MVAKDETQRGKPKQDRVTADFFDAEFTGLITEQILIGQSFKAGKWKPYSYNLVWQSELFQDDIIHMDIWMFNSRTLNDGTSGVLGKQRRPHCEASRTGENYKPYHLPWYLVRYLMIFSFFFSSVNQNQWIMNIDIYNVWLQLYIRISFFFFPLFFWPL